MINQTLNALSETNRFNIIKILTNGDCTVGELTEKLQIRQPQVSKHLKVLNDAGIVTQKPIKQQRVYSLSVEPFEELENWLFNVRKTWNNRLDRLDKYIEEYKQKQTKLEQNDESKTK